MTPAHVFKPLQYTNRLVYIRLLPPRVPPLARLGLVPQTRGSTTSGTLSCGCAVIIGSATSWTLLHSRGVGQSCSVMSFRTGPFVR